jgi:hypothetical protein
MKKRMKERLLKKGYAQKLKTPVPAPMAEDGSGADPTFT